MAELKIATFQERSRSNVVQLLEGLIERVKAGEFDAVTILADKAESDRCIVFEAGAFDLSERLGRIEILKAELLRDALGG